MTGRVVPAGPVYQYGDSLYCCYPCSYHTDGPCRCCWPECGSAAGGVSSRSSFPVILPSHAPKGDDG
jgi:hypothetical protein